MKISEVIKKLQEIKDEYGDIQVRILLGEHDASFGCMDFSVDKHTLYIE